MTISRPAIAFAMASTVLCGLGLAASGLSRAQGPEHTSAAGHSSNISDLMLQPIRLPFAKETALEDVVAYLRKETKANVVLDLAALNRHDLKKSSKVSIDLDSVRLKTGLKLLLDQVGLTTKLVPEDNLLIITDKAEGDELIVRVLDEIKALHRDLHSLQDEVREVRAILIAPPEEEEPAAKMRNPTIIEEVPPRHEGEKHDAKSKPEKPERTRPGL